MIIATFNINGIVKRLDNLVAWLAAAQPDVVALQEIKCYDREFPHRALAAAEYRAIVRGQGPHHGVAILARHATPIETRRELPGDPSDKEARYIEAAVNGVLVGCLYAPNGNPQPGPKFDYKLAWLARLVGHARDLRAQGVPAVLAGDYNVVPTDFDISSPRSWRKNALLQPEPRRLYALLLELGWSDALRTLFPSDPMFTFWQYYRDAWPRDAGWRIDHLLLDDTVAQRLIAGGVDRAVRDAPNASDHAPAWIVLDDA